MDFTSKTSVPDLSMTPISTPSSWNHARCSLFPHQIFMEI